MSLIVTMFFIGLAAGQLVYGPMSDRFGRKRALWVGLGIYVLGAVGTTMAPNFEALLAARVLWGVGAAGPRVVALAILRDRYEGNEMARVMLVVQAVFMIAPILAPVWGQLWLSIGTWRWTFGQAAVAGGLLVLWALRLPETLPAEKRNSLRLADLKQSMAQIARTRQTVGMGLAQTCLFGAFFPWLGSSELIIGEIYQHKSWYPVIFAGMGISMASATIVSSRLVAQHGATRLSRILLVCFVGVSGAGAALSVALDGKPPFWLFLCFIPILLAIQTATTPNVATLALEPMGHIAGLASSIVGTVNFAGGAGLAYLVDSRFEDTVTPLFVGMFVYGTIALLLVRWASGARTA